MLSETRRFLDLARAGNNSWWRYLLGVVVVASSGLWAALFFGLVDGFLQGFGVASSPEVRRVLDTLTYARTDPSVLSFFALNLSIIGMIAGLYVVLRVLHGRTMISVITPLGAIDWRRIVYGAAVGFVILSIVSLTEHLLYPGRYRFVFDAARFWPFLIAVVVLTPLQAAAEEVVFRGYLTQGLGLLLRQPIVIVVVTSALFALLHLANPEATKYGMGIMFANYFMSGLLLAGIAMRDGRLELAIGLHAVNNMFTALIANIEGSALQTPSIFMSRLDPVFALVGMAATMFAFHWWVFERVKVQPASEA